RRRERRLHVLLGRFLPRVLALDLLENLERRVAVPFIGLVPDGEPDDGRTFRWRCVPPLEPSLAAAARWLVTTGRVHCLIPARGNELVVPGAPPFDLGDRLLARLLPLPPVHGA